MALGSDYTCALVTGGGAKCWGCNDFGQLGIGNLLQQSRPADLDFGSGAFMRCMHYVSPCVLLETREEKSLGSLCLEKTSDFEVDVVSITPTAQLPPTPKPARGSGRLEFRRAQADRMYSLSEQTGATGCCKDFGETQLV
jgi:hypothetical protein